MLAGDDAHQSCACLALSGVKGRAQDQDIGVLLLVGVGAVATRTHRPRHAVGTAPWPMETACNAW